MIFTSGQNKPVGIDIQTVHKLIGELTTQANKSRVLSVRNDASL